MTRRSRGSTGRSKKTSSGGRRSEWVIFAVGILMIIYLFRFGMPWGTSVVDMDLEPSKGPYPQSRVMIIKEGAVVGIQMPKGK